MKMTKYLSLTTILIAAMTPTAARAVTFEQAALDAGYTYASTGTIDVRYRDINTLTGVNNFTAATRIDAWNNNVTGIATDQFSGLGNLQYLELDGNQISSIESDDFSGLENLTNLHLDDNQISSIESGDFSGLGNLTSLDLENNQISSIESGDFSGLGNLTSLDLDDNQISSIESGDFSGLGNLQHLELDDNQISSIESDDFSGLGNLQRLFLRNNQISSIGENSFDGMTSLEAMFLWDNNLSHLNLCGADFENLSAFGIMVGNSISSVDLSEASLSDLAFQALMEELDDGGVASMELRGADLSAVGGLSPMYELDVLATLDLAYAQLPDLDALDELVAQLEPLALDDLTLSWDQWTPMAPATQTYLAEWGALPANTLTIVPEPTTLVLLTSGALGLLACGWRRRRKKAPWPLSGSCR